MDLPLINIARWLAFSESDRFWRDKQTRSYLLNEAIEMSETGDSRDTDEEIARQWAAANGYLLQPAITGYRRLSQGEVDLMNEGKAIAEHCRMFVEKLRAYVPEHEDKEATAIAPGRAIDQRWVSIGATHLQEGWMAIIRGIAKPETF